MLKKNVIKALPNLTGVYDCNDGGTYYLRQVGRILWWFGEDDNAGFTNVYRGIINQTTNTITGTWADVPKGENLGSGRLTLKGTANDTVVLDRTFVTGGFGGSKWTRVSTSSKKVNQKFNTAMKKIKK
ncbi:hypothetical protein [Paenibacillus aceris]|uniref:Uncharacterized protein n=1 Tax=Paenibacillus aceris TaxID=869555 RepID=A0ABS4HT13_9BACL|nr:hypothetical protein [Paenibacillus aceris]MBP1961164.1 hypothetical protein [Paenibacillus aceris]NHW35184.1 hypothetical protein [Paenibacillus aceris]